MDCELCEGEMIYPHFVDGLKICDRCNDLGGEPRTHGAGCICADCSGAELTAGNN